MINFSFRAVTKIIFGKGEENNVGTYLKNDGATKVMVCHYGTGMDFENVLIERINKSLKDAGLEVVDFQNIAANPTLERAKEGSKLCKEEKVDYLLAVGGGSVIDTAKYIAVDVLYDGDTWNDFYAHFGAPDKALPVSTIVTIASTGSEAGNSSVLTNNGEKLMLTGDVVYPRITIMDPELTFSLPPYQTASGIADMFCHEHERYFCTEDDNYVTDELGEGVMRAIIECAPTCIKEPTNYAARANIMWSSVVAHNEMCGVGRIPDWAVHAIQHPLSAFYNSAHGHGCAVISLAWIRYVYKNNIKRFVRYFTKVWGVENNETNPEAVIEEGLARQKAFYESLGLKTSIYDLGFKDEDIDDLAMNAIISYASTDANKDTKIGNFAQLSFEDIKAIYELAK